MKDGETTTLRSLLRVNEDKTRIVLIRDEAHHNDTTNMRAFVEMVKPITVINVTATATSSQRAKVGVKNIVQVHQQDVVMQGKVRSQIVVNDAQMPDSALSDISWEGLIVAGIHRRDMVQEEYVKVGMGDVVPLAVIQVPNDDKSDKHDSRVTVANVLEVKRLLKKHGVQDDDILVWTAEQHDINPTEIKESPHRFLIVKIACAEGWNCPRAQVLIKLRQQSKSETLDAQTLGRFMRTTNPHEWQTNKAYQNDEILNSAYIYTADEDYDVSLDGYNIRDPRFVQKVRDRYKDVMSRIHLVSTMPGMRKFDEDSTPIVEELIKLFNQNFPYSYTSGIKWCPSDNVTRRIAQTRYDAVTMMDAVLDNGRAIGQHGRIQLNDEEIEKYVGEQIDRYPLLKRYHRTISGAIDEHVSINLYDGQRDDFDMPIDSREMREKRNAFLRAIANNLDDFISVCTETIDAYATYARTSIFDGHDALHPMYTPPVEMFSGMALSNVPDSSNFAYDKHGTYKSKSERSMVAEIMPSMDYWWKNGTHSADSFCIAYEDDGGRPRAFFPDFIAVKGRTLFVLETKGAKDILGDHAIAPDRDRCKASAVSTWLSSKMCTQSLQACDSIDRIVFGICKQVNNEWHIYIGNGATYDDTACSDWKPFIDVLGEHVAV